jgi:hypothetical protein
MAPRPVAPRFRQRKLSTRIALQVIREKELEPLDSDQQSAPKVETGVEKHEETVSFLFFLLLYPFCAFFIFTLLPLLDHQNFHRSGKTFIRYRLPFIHC